MFKKNRTNVNQTYYIRPYFIFISHITTLVTLLLRIITSINIFKLEYCTFHITTKKTYLCKQYIKVSS